MATGYNFQAFPPGTSASTVTGPGDPLGGDGGIVSRIQYGVEIGATATVNFEHSVDGVNYHPLAVLDTSTTGQTYVTSITASGIFQADATGSTKVRVNVASSTGTVVATANKVLG